MRVLSMQGKVVWDILQRDKVYHANKDLCRENNTYVDDIENLDGMVPIWGMMCRELSLYTMYDGEILNDLRLQMSLDMVNCWDGFVLFELEIPRDNLIRGVTRNVRADVKVFPELRLDMVKAVYTLKDAKTPYFKVITPIWISSGDEANVITTTTLDFEQLNEYMTESTLPLTPSVEGECLWCKKETSYVVNNKHFCCLAHAFDLERKFMRISVCEELDEQYAREWYDNATDADFERSYLKTIRELADNIKMSK